MNYFAPQTAAARYAEGRPYFHENTIGHIKAYLPNGVKIEKALDIACGTGLSTKALLIIADKVCGTDISPQMLSFAPTHPNITYAVATAEKQPYADNEFELITVSSGVHWFNIDAFLQEAHRLLKPNGWLVLYENYFISEMEGVEAFTNWFPSSYLKKYPSPPRNGAYSWTNENLLSRGFSLIKEESFKNPVPLTKQQLRLYFTTQSNIIAAVESGVTTYTEVEHFLDKELSPFFTSENEVATVQYGNWIKYIRKIS